MCTRKGLLPKGASTTFTMASATAETSASAGTMELKPLSTSFANPRAFIPPHREAVAAIHASSGLSSGHISLSSVAPDISRPPLLDEAAEAKLGHGHLFSLS